MKPRHGRYYENQQGALRMSARLRKKLLRLVTATSAVRPNRPPAEICWCDCIDGVHSEACVEMDAAVADAEMERERKAKKTMRVIFFISEFLLYP